MSWTPWPEPSSSIAVVTTGIHATAGGRSVVRPLLRSTVAAEPKRTLHVVWHMVTADLLLGSLVLRLPQWMLLLPVAVLAFVGSNHGGT
ncbi:hypothetical protein ACFY3O_05190 [Streptomyces sp. NPDC001046]|uniref:hypothetical protein n=1 Tax=unclassified Streptomyces TaxID=2593676 RepID=UPI0036A220A8